MEGDLVSTILQKLLQVRSIDITQQGNAVQGRWLHKIPPPITQFKNGIKEKKKKGREGGRGCGVSYLQVRVTEYYVSTKSFNPILSSHSSRVCLCLRLSWAALCWLLQEGREAGEKRSTVTYGDRRREGDESERGAARISPWPAPTLLSASKYKSWSTVHGDGGQPPSVSRSVRKIACHSPPVSVSGTTDPRIAQSTGWILFFLPNVPFFLSAPLPVMND